MTERDTYIEDLRKQLELKRGDHPSEGREVFIEKTSTNDRLNQERFHVVESPTKLRSSIKQKTLKDKIRELEASNKSAEKAVQYKVVNGNLVV